MLKKKLAVSRKGRKCGICHRTLSIYNASDFCRACQSSGAVFAREQR